MFFGTCYVLDTPQNRWVLLKMETTVKPSVSICFPVEKNQFRMTWGFDRNLRVAFGGLCTLHKVWGSHPVTAEASVDVPIQSIETRFKGYRGLLVGLHSTEQR